jgi:hypothetical protein
MEAAVEEEDEEEEEASAVGEAAAEGAQSDERVSLCALVARPKEASPRN